MDKGRWDQGVKNNGADGGGNHWNSGGVKRGGLDDGAVRVTPVRFAFAADIGSRASGVKNRIRREGKAMKIGINCGHTISGPGFGAVGAIKESEHTRQVGYALMGQLRAAGAETADCTIDRADTQMEYLQTAVALANREDLDWFISIHFNASPAHQGQGVEIYTYEGRKYEEAVNICANLAELGLKNRGVKKGTGLYVVRRSKAKAMLVEVCFCDNQDDVNIYRKAGAEAVAEAICKGICGGRTGQTPHKTFEEFVGRIAKEDWGRRRIVLPSVVVAQAIKESAWGTSELARNANALFGIKKNGWTGRAYKKAATEQRKDGSYYIEDNTLWRAYDSWEQSVYDHNDYIATRSVDGGRTLKYAKVVGCDDYMLACRYLQECGYATSLTYGESLVRDYIEKYHLLRFDSCSSSDPYKN